MKQQLLQLQPYLYQPLLSETIEISLKRGGFLMSQKIKDHSTKI